jgi:lipooligosaccharide transport system permease protein
LPGWIQQVAAVLPLAQAIELVRPLFMDQWPSQPLLHLGLLLAYAVGAFWVALALTRRRFKG